MSSSRRPLKRPLPERLCGHIRGLSPMAGSMKRRTSERAWARSLAVFDSAVAPVAAPQSARIT